jgi:hypothetical protein
MVDDSRMWADEDGIWKEDRPGFPFEIRWDEIHTVSGYRFDDIDEIDTIITLDTEFGEFCELNSSVDGFDQVARTITARLEGIDPRWLDTILGLSPDDEPVQVWRRAVDD